MSDRLVRMLFIGNSFTTRNDLPAMLSEIALARGVAIQHKVIARGGASLRRHFNAGATEAIIEADWDYVVLQEQSTLPIKNRTRFHENVREFVPAVREAGAELALYMTWARKTEPEDQELLTGAYNDIGREIEATVVPAGAAWELLLAKHDKPPLHDSDGSHPTIAGTYLAACTFSLTLFGAGLINITSNGLTDEDQKRIQGFARAACE